MTSRLTLSHPVTLKLPLLTFQEPYDPRRSRVTWAKRDLRPRRPLPPATSTVKCLITHYQTSYHVLIFQVLLWVALSLLRDDLKPHVYPFHWARMPWVCFRKPCRSVFIFAHVIVSMYIPPLSFTLILFIYLFLRFLSKARAHPHPHTYALWNRTTTKLMYSCALAEQLHTDTNWNLHSA